MQQQHNRIFKLTAIERWGGEGGSVPLDPNGFAKRATTTKRPRSIARHGKMRRAGQNRSDFKREQQPVFLG